MRTALTLTQDSLAAANVNTAVLTSIAGLPLHPLVVHAAVVLLPLAALAVIATAVVPKWRRTYGGIVGIAVASAGAATFMAKESGEALAARIGEPHEHAEWGNRLFLIAGVFCAISLVWLLVAWRSPGVLSTFLGGMAALMAVAVGVATVYTGHSGAKATWEGTLTQPAATSPNTGTPGTPTTPAAYTLAQVGTHTSSASCWAAINGSVYDLTDWINQHPGGPNRILTICGTDASAVFSRQHRGEPKPAAALATRKIGPLRAN